jgi:hypothetical protein
MRLLIALIVYMGIVRCQRTGPLTYLGDGLYKGDEVCSSSVNLPAQCPAPPGAYMSSETITNFDWSCVPDFYASWHIFCYYRGCTPEPPANVQFTTGCSWSCNSGFVLTNGSCVLSCNAGYYTYNGNCTVCTAGDYSEGGVSVGCSPCTNGPPRSTYTGSGTTATNCPWVCGAGSVRNVSNQCPFCVAGECIYSIYLSTPHVWLS